VVSLSSGISSMPLLGDGVLEWIYRKTKSLHIANRMECNVTRWLCNHMLYLQNKHILYTKSVTYERKNGNYDVLYIVYSLSSFFLYQPTNLSRYLSQRMLFTYFIHKLEDPFPIHMHLPTIHTMLIVIAFCA